MPEEATTNTTKTETPAEPKGTFLEAAQTADWNNNLQIIEPGVTTEDGKTAKEGTQTEEEIKEEVKTEVKTEAPAQEVEQTIEIEDPGEFKAGDYAFEVTTYDAEGKKPKTTKITSVEQWDQLLDTDPNFGSATALLKAQRLSTKMETGLERDKASYDTKKAEYDEAVANQAARDEASQSMVNEISYLVNRGELPPVAAEYANADWSDPKIAAQPGVKEQVALLDYMSKENTARQKAGLKPLTSVLDAWNGYQLDEAKKTAQTQNQRVAEARKEAGARVAGVSPNPVTAAPRGIMVGRGGSLDELGRGNWEV